MYQNMCVIFKLANVDAKSDAKTVLILTSKSGPGVPLRPNRALCWPVYFVTVFALSCVASGGLRQRGGAVRQL